MQEILNKLIESLENGNILLALVLSAIALIINARRILEYVESRKKLRIESLKEALSSEYVKSETRLHLENELEAEYFKLATGLNVEVEFREALLDLHKSAKGEVSFVHFKRAFYHLGYKSDNSEVTVNITAFDKVSFWFNWLAGVSMGVLGIFMLFIPGMSKGIPIVQIIITTGMGFFFWAVCMLMVYQTLPVYSARKIQGLLENAKKIDPKNN